MRRLGLQCFWLVCFEFIQLPGLCHCSWAPLREGHHSSNPRGSAKDLQNDLQEQDRKTVQDWRQPLESCNVVGLGKLQAISWSGCCVGHTYFKTWSYPTTFAEDVWSGLGHSSSPPTSASDSLLQIQSVNQLSDAKSVHTLEIKFP